MLAQSGAGRQDFPVIRLQPNAISMMKTKLTLFVTVIAAALFMGGCASSNIPAPEGGVDLVGSGMAGFS